jgi:hypothetical protein
MKRPSLATETFAAWTKTLYHFSTQYIVRERAEKKRYLKASGNGEPRNHEAPEKHFRLTTTALKALNALPQKTSSRLSGKGAFPRPSFSNNP